jgi:pimeloyl-ACP methyl ester carboxylesterase
MQPDTICIWNLNLCYRTLGEGPDVLFVHGWASSGRMWQAAMRALADRYRCWAVDLVGFGDSDKPANGWYALPNYTATLHQFAETVGLRQAHVVGHSMGGMIALDLAAAYPALVRRLAVINPAVTGRIEFPLPPRLDIRPRYPLLALASRAWPAAAGFALRYPVSAWTAFRGLLRRWEDWAKPTADSALGGIQAILDYDTTPLLPRILAPTLVMIGEHDPTISPSEGRLAAERIPNARLEVLPAGHQIFDERPREFLALLSAFLDSAD